ncbi:hypothetical protein BGX27_003443 [Mortierella sp. AM989]|nr:hypothetical protein BGX27_003443 [Mortierella sp. AM989]
MKLLYNFSTLVLERSNSDGWFSGLTEDSVVVLDRDISQDPEAILTTLDTRVAGAASSGNRRPSQASKRDRKALATHLESDGVLGFGNRAGYGSSTLLGRFDRALDVLVNSSSGSSANDDQSRAGVNNTL